MIVDDSVEDRDFTKRLLTRASAFDWEFTEAAEGKRGLALALGGGPFDSILLNYRLGDMDGTEFLDRLQAQSGDANPAPVVVLTGAGDEGAAVRALKLGVQDYLSKHDLNSQPLLRAVEYSISRAQLRRANRESAQALAASEERCRSLVEAVPQVIIWTANPQGVLDFANAHWVECLGITLEEFNGSTGRPLVNAEDGQSVSDAWAAGLGSGQPFEIEHQLPQRGETGLRWHLSRATPIRDESGCVVKWIGSSTDIEDRKRAAVSILNADRADDMAVREAKEALRQGATLRNAIFKSSHFLSIATDEKGVIQLFNAGAEVMLGYSTGEIIGRMTPDELADPRELAERTAKLSHELARPITPGFEALACRAAGGIEDTYELTYVRKNGSRLPAVVSISALREGNGRIIGYVLIGTDNTAAKQAEAARQRLDQMLLDQQFYTRSLMESSSDALIATDPAGQIIDVNEQAEALTGCTRHELIGEPFKSFFTDGSRAQAGIKQALSAGRIAGYELTARARSGRETAVSCHATAFKGRSGQLQGVFVAARDISDRKRLEQALREKTAELERIKGAAEKAKTITKMAFLGGMSQEIRTPMNAILGMSDLLAESQLDAEQTQYVEVLQRAGGNLLVLINNLLDLSKIEAGDMELEQRDFDLEDLVDHLMELTGIKSRAKGIVLLSHLLPDLVTSVSGDARRLGQVLTNLLDNAVKSTTAGVVLLTVQNRESKEAGGKQTGPEIEFVISDTGAGIATDKLETILHGFSKADWSMTPQDGGTGLALELSRSLVELMGGKLTVTSRLGEGSTFRFNIPFESPSQRKSPLEVTDFHGLRVLVINDDATNRLILCEALNGWGMETSEFSRPSEALADLTAASEAKRPYSLVILDRSISGMDGFETTVRVKQVAPEVPVIMLTSDVRAGDVQRNRAAGLSGYAVKPVKRTELLRLLSVALGPRQITEVTGRESGDPTESIAAPSLKILIAEDSEDNRLLLQLYLKGSPHRLTFAGDGRAAVERFAAERWDLVLMDLYLPVMDGLAATRAIRTIEEERGSAPTVVIAMTANGRLKDIEASVSAGCNHYLWKPLSRHALLTAIKDYKQLGAAANEGTQLEPPKWVEIQMPAGLENIVPRYLASRRNEVPEMMAMLAASSFDRIAAIAHNMKGTGTSYGFPALTRMGGALERSAKQRDAGALDAQLAELNDYLGRVVLLGKL